MSLNSETITQIQAMLQADPALLAQLQAETELAGVAAAIAKAATAQGLDVNEADLMSHLAAEQSQASAATMSDTELEQVAAGLGGLIFYVGPKGFLEKIRRCFNECYQACVAYCGSRKGYYRTGDGP